MDSWDSSVIDLDEDNFRPTEWINCGKTWPADPPPSLLMARAELLMVPPDAFSPFFPVDPIHISAYHFVNASLPPRSSDIITGHTDFWFSRDPPSSDVKQLILRSVPPMHFVNQLKVALGSYWLQGNQSIVDPRNGGSDRFPFYVLEFWTQVTEVRETQMRWGQAIKYVERQKHSAPDSETKVVFDKAWEMLHLIGWNELMPHYNIHTTSFTEFLGPGNELASFLCERERKESNGHSNQPI